jgi:hypothetical protein
MLDKFKTIHSYKYEKELFHIGFFINYNTFAFHDSNIGLKMIALND